MAGYVVAVTGAAQQHDSRFVVAECAAALAGWGHDVLCVDTVPVDGDHRPRNGFPLEIDLSGLATHRLASSPGRVSVLSAPEDASGPYGSEAERDQWSTDHDVVLVAAPPYGTTPDSPWCYRMADLVVGLHDADTTGAGALLAAAAGWAYHRDLLPLDRSQLVVVPVALGGDRDDVLVGDLCGNWVDRTVPVEHVLKLLARPAPESSAGLDLFGLVRSLSGTPLRPQAESLAALVAHRGARTGLLAEDRGRYLAAATRQPADAFAYDVVIGYDWSNRRTGDQLAASLAGEGLRVRASSTDEQDSFGVDPPDRSAHLTRAVCLLVGEGQERALSAYAEQVAGPRAGTGPLPLVVVVLMPPARPSALTPPATGAEWIRFDRRSGRIAETARRIVAILGE